jgi:aerotaxis receptor
MTGYLKFYHGVADNSFIYISFVLKEVNNMDVPVAKEKKMQLEDLIVSKTDTKGRITYCNDTFMEFAGYWEEDLLGQSHNIIRHPDMPRAVFRLLWQTLQEEKEFFGFIKNKRKNGDFYWTFANVTASFNSDSRVIGYFSLRRYPVPEAIAFFDSLYQRMCEVESQHSSSQQAMDASSQILQQGVAEKGGYNELICSYYK